MKLFVCGREVRIKLSRGRYMRLKIDGEDGGITLYLPNGVGAQSAERFLKEKAGWTERTLNKIEQAKKSNSAPEGFVLLFGEYFPVIPSGKTEFANGAVHIKQSALCDDASAKREEDKLKKRLLLNYVLPKMEYYGKIMGVTHGDVCIRNMNTRWGSCNVKTKKITFSLKLAGKAAECIDYVVAHELAHLYRADHGREFKAFLTAVMPDWKTRKKLLNGV